MSHGFLLKPIEQDHFIFGSGQLGDSPVNPSGQWGSWLPIKENQSVSGFDPQACVSFATLNCVETMLAQRLGKIQNYSDRFLAFTSGTTQYGNDPHTVAEALRKIGDVPQEDWDYSADTWDTYYVQPPKKLYKKAQEFTFEYAFGHSWVTDTSQENMMKALTYSPLAVGVSAWTLDPQTGYYIRNGRSNHCVMLFGYERNNYWLIFDSYEQNVKKLAWNHGFEGVKRFTLDRNVKIEEPWQKFLAFWRNFFGL